MIIRGDKIYRSLEEQVFKNQWDIQSIQEQTGMLGIKPVAQVVTVEQLPLVGSEAYKALAYGDAYAVGDDSVVDPTFRYFVKAKLLGVDGWLALGYIRGEQGPKGDTGDIGPAGTISAANATVDYNTGVPTVDLVLGGTPTNRTFTFNFHNLKGQKGDRGPAGSVEVVAPYWDSTKSYTKNSWVVYDDVLYKAIQNVPVDTLLTPDYWEAIPDGLSSILKVVIEDYGEGTFTARDDVARQDIANTRIDLLDTKNEVANLVNDVAQAMADVAEVRIKANTLEDGYEALVAENKQLKFKIADLQNIVYDTVVEDAEVVYTDLDTASIPGYVEKDGSTHKVFDGAETMLKEIAGKTKQVNQLYDHLAWDSQTVNGVDIIKSADGFFNLIGESTSSANVPLCSVSITAGHVYLLYRENDEVVDPGNNLAFMQLYGGSGNYAQIKNNATLSGVIWTAVNSYADGLVRIRINEGTIYTNYWVTPKVVDLTMLYGAGNEPSNVDTVLADNPWILTTNEVISDTPYSAIVSGVKISGTDSSWEFTLPASETLGNGDKIKLVKQSDDTWDVEKVVGAVTSTLMTGLTEPDVATLINPGDTIEILGNTNKAYVKPDLATIIQIEKAVIS